jgi:glycosyltransferase involved in cell wall biosynthesis
MINKSSARSEEKAPLVSITVPVYNGDAFMEECLQSILDQTFMDWECVVVNNRSTDRTAEIVQQFVDRDPRFHMVDCEDFVGLIENWNRLYPHIAEGSKYFKVVQADDYLYPDSIGEMVEVMEANDNVGMCSSYRIDGLKIDGGGLNYFGGPVFSGQDLLIRHLNSEIDISGSVTTLLFRKSDLEKLPTFPKIFDDRDYHVDTLLAYEMMNIADVGFVFKMLSITRVHAGADTIQTAEKFSTFRYSREYRFHRFKSLHPDLEKPCREQRLSYAYYLFRQKIKGNRDCIAWHNQYLIRKFSFGETFIAVLINNGISFRLRLLFGKKKPKNTNNLNA